MRYILGTIIILIGVYMLLNLVKQNQPITKEVALVIDVTDSTVTKPRPDEILRLYNLSGKNKWNIEAIFHSSTFSDVSYTNSYEIKLEAENMWLSNEFEREEKIKAFEEGITNELNSNDSAGKRHSSIYLPLARELNRLSQSKAQQKVLIVYSDLMENSPELSFYREGTLRSLKTNPGAIKAILEKQTTLPDLTGIEVHFIYQPATTEKDNEFNIVSKFYGKLLEEKGAQVTVSANL